MMHDGSIDILMQRLTNNLRLLPFPVHQLVDPEAKVAVTRRLQSRDFSKHFPGARLQPWPVRVMDTTGQLYFWPCLWATYFTTLTGKLSPSWCLLLCKKLSWIKMTWVRCFLCSEYVWSFLKGTEFTIRHVCFNNPKMFLKGKYLTCVIITSVWAVHFLRQDFLVLIILGLLFLFVQEWSPAASLWPMLSANSSAACSQTRSAPAGSSPLACSWWEASM